MWINECGHNEPNSYVQRTLDKIKESRSMEEKYQEKIEEACKWLNDRLVRDIDTRNVKFIASDYDSIGDIIRDFRKMMQIH